MNSEDYIEKMREHLACGSYVKLDKDPSKKITKKVTKTIRSEHLDDHIKNKLYPKDCIQLRIYGLPNIHKDGVPLRPIVNTIGLPM